MGKNIEVPNNIDYGFYSIGKRMYVDEYKNPIKEPALVGVYGAYTSDEIFGSMGVPKGLSLKSSYSDRL